jgi:hypothetical protein
MLRTSVANMDSTEININNSEKEADKAEQSCCTCRCHRVPVTLRDTFFQDPFFSRRFVS